MNRSRKCMSQVAFYMVVFVLELMSLHDVMAGEAPTEQEGFFGKLMKDVSGAVKDGVDNGVQSAGPVKVLGYVMMFSKLKNSDQPAYCLANAETDKLITVSPMFGSPYKRADGTTGFVTMQQPVDKYHHKIEVNLLGTVPGHTCADLIAKKALKPFTGKL